MIFYLLFIVLFVGLVLLGLGRYGNRFNDCDFESRKTIKDKIKLFMMIWKLLA